MTQHIEPAPAILHICTERTLRGGERQCLLLHQNLLARHHQSYIACRNGSQLALQGDKNILTPLTSGIYSISSFISLNKIIKRYSIVIIHAHDSKALTIATILSTFNKKLRVVYSRKSLFLVKNTFSNRFKYASIDIIIAISNAVADSIAAIKKTSSVDIIHDAVRLTPSDIDRKTARKQFGIEPDHFCIGSVAFFTQEKNLPLLLKCVEYFKKKVTPAVRFLLIGPVEPSLEDQIKAQPSIIAPGYLQDAERYYPAFDAYVSTSFLEGLGSALIDAIVRDIPSAAMDAGGTKDCFGTFKTPAGSIEDLLKQLDTIIKNYSEAKSEAIKLGKWARTEFNVENFVNKHVALYRTASTQFTPGSGKTV